MILSWPIFESIEIKTSTLVNLDFVNDNILSCFLFYFLIIGLYILTPAVITQIFNPIAELVITIEIPTKETKAELETHPVTVQIHISKCSV